MSGSKNRGELHTLNGSIQSTNPETVATTLDNVQRFATEQRAIAEEVLAKARDFEEKVADERRAVDELASFAETARVAEQEAAAALKAAREKLATAEAAEKQARSEVDTGLRLLDERREARLREEAELARIQTGLEQLSSRNGMNSDAIQRMLERRIADRLRENATRGAT